MPLSGRRGEQLDPGPDPAGALQGGEDGRLRRLPQRLRQSCDPRLLLVQPYLVTGRQRPESHRQPVRGYRGQLIHG